MKLHDNILFGDKQDKIMGNGRRNLDFRQSARRSPCGDIIPNPSWVPLQKCVYLALEVNLSLTDHLDSLFLFCGQDQSRNLRPFPEYVTI